MPSFSTKSLERLRTCHKDLQNLFLEVVRYADCTVTCGHRGEEEQNKAFAEGRSKIQYPHGKHNSVPSLAVDVYPYPYDWDNPDSKHNYFKLYHFAGIVKGIAWELGLQVRWGGDWDSDGDLFDQSFYDLPHWEIVL